MLPAVAGTYSEPFVRTLSVADGPDLPAAPQDSDGKATVANNASGNPGVLNTRGAKALMVDVLAPNGATGNASIVPYAWNNALRAWVQASPVQLVPVATTLHSGDGTVGQRVSFTNWASDYAWVAVTALPAGAATLKLSIVPQRDQ